ncbi:solute carrier family 41 member 1-like [Oppia nitens]|uniref:solute carrier family 41 member 1-like n=1 Tax=Oppia nitens TaxID=1686743 RepID=UPI0023DABA16|nr:solute carrier family 41 member 1-like [Oppia nitens]
MSEKHLRNRLIAINTKRDTTSHHMMSRNTDNHTDYQPMDDHMSDDDDHSGDELDSDKQTDDKAVRSKFATNDRQELIELIYSEDVIKFSKNNALRHNNSLHRHSDSDSDQQNDEMMTSFINSDKKPLLDLVNKKKSRLKRKSYKSEYLLTDDSDDHSDHQIVYEEGIISLYFQVFVPFLIAGFGTVGAGLVLDYVQHWDVFKQVSEVFILVPALLGLKGNLEMTLASRLSTQANLGHIETGREQWQIASGNIALIQCQATIVAFLAAIFAITMDWLPEGDFNFSHALLLCASSLLTASIASFILGLLMIVVVIVSHKCRINPDNVATPIAASLGDLITLALLAKFSDMLYYTVETSSWLCVAIIVVFLLLIPVWCYYANKNKYTNEVLYNGWTPVISAMAISSIGGCILDFAVSRFKGIAVFQPVINGVGGNLVAVQASRISTHLHKNSKLGILPKSDAKLCFNPCSAFFGKSIHARTARVLILMVIPGHIIFTYGIRFLQAGHTSITFHFLVVYLLAALLQVILLLYFAHTMILYMWKKAVDPDNSAIPYLTALGDLLGTALLAIAFLILFSIGDKDSDVGD